MEFEDIRPGQIYRLTTGAADIPIFNDPRTWNENSKSEPQRAVPYMGAYDEFMVVEIILHEDIYYAYVFLLGEDIAGYIKLKRAIIENYKIYSDDLDDWELVL